MKSFESTRKIFKKVLRKIRTMKVKNNRKTPEAKYVRAAITSHLKKVLHNSSTLIAAINEAKIIALKVEERNLKGKLEPNEKKQCLYHTTK